MRYCATTLKGMAAHGLYDHVAGGFFRYSTRRDWSVPHFEKMLEDNARLASLYLEATVLARGDAPSETKPASAGLGSVALYRDAAAGTIDYLLATLWRDELPGFGGSQDADEHYYSLDAAGRAGLPALYVDLTVYVDWNALAARALLRAALVLQRPEATQACRGDARLSVEHGRHDVAMAHYLATDGDPAAGAPLLVDQATMGGGPARRLRGHGREEVAGGRAGARRLGRPGTCAPPTAVCTTASPSLESQRRASGAPAAGARRERAQWPTSSCASRPTPARSFWRDRALDVLTAWATHYEQSGVAAAAYGQALLRYLDRPDHIVVVGRWDDDAARRLYDAALTAPRPLRTVQFLDPEDTGRGADGRLGL